MFFKPTVLQHQLNDLAQREACGLLAQHIELGDESAQIGTRLARHRTDTVVQRAARRARHILQLLNGAQTNAARRKINHAHEAGVVLRVLQQAQIRQRVLDFGALEKAQAAVHAVRHASIKKRSFHHPALRVAAVKQRNFLALCTIADELFDLIDKPLCLGKVTGRFRHPHRLARTGFGAQVFPEPLAVVADELVGRIKNISETAVIALQLDLLRDIEFTHKICHVADPRAAKSVNALVVVAHRHH